MSGENEITAGAGRIGRAIARLTDPDNPAPMSRRGWVLIWAILALALIPTLVLPLAPDQALYFVFGQKILQGGIPYRDVIDIKQPLIYYLYAVAVFLFGNGSVSIRILDLLLQLVTCWLLIRIIRKGGGNDLIASLAPIFYLMVYLGQGYGILALPESFVGLLGGGMIYMLLYRRTTWGFVLIGILSALLFLMKFTLAVMLTAMIACEWMLFDESWRTRWGNAAKMIAGFLAGPLALLVFLITTGALTGFIEVEVFTGHYVRNEMHSLSQWLKNLSTLIPYHLAIDYSLVLLAGLGVGIGIAFGLGRSSRTNTVRLLQVCVVTFLFLLASIVVEAKYHTSHITRYYAICAILSSFGIVAMLRAMATRGFSPRKNAFHAVMLGVIGLSLILYSPIAGYGWRTAAIGWKNVRRFVGLENPNSPMVQDMPLEESRQIASYVKSHWRPGDRILVSASIAGLVYHTCDYVPDYRLLHSAFLTAQFSPSTWTEGTRDYILNRKPHFIVAQFNDSFPSITGSSTTAIMALRALPGIDSVLNNDYRPVLRTMSMELYERKQ